VSASLESLAGQVLIAGFPGTSAPPGLVDLASRGALGGIILFKRNLGSVYEVADLIGRFETPDAPLFVAIDQEGGRVARLGPPIVKLPPMRALAGTGDVQLVRDAGAFLGKQLAALGFTMDFAPVLDVDTNPDNPVIGDRSFGSTAEEVERFAFAFADGLADSGIGACGKHFPGHGDTDLDSHLALPKLAHGRPRLDAVELRPFRACRGRVPAIMSAHVVFDAIEPDVPATLSHRAMTTLLREELGWDGVTISDDLEMKAVADLFPIETLAVRAIEAGCDALLICSDLGRFERARIALRDRAIESTAFRARLEDAASRFLAMRNAHRRTARSREAIEIALDARGTAELEARVANALATAQRTNELGR